MFPFMGGVKVAKEAGNNVQSAALVMEKWYREKTEAMDEGCVKLKIIVQCKSEENHYAPPVQVLLNGIQQCEIVSKEGQSCVEHEAVVWYSAKITQDGISKIRIELVPTDGAEKYFGKGKPPGRKYTPIYRRNEREKYANGRYECTATQDDSSECHRIIVNVPIKRRWFGGRYGPNDLKLYRCKVEEAKSQMRHS